MLGLYLLLIAGGIGFAHAVQNPGQVTLRWIRLGGIVALTMLAAVLVHQIATGAQVKDVLMTALVGVAFTVQVLTVQLGRRTAQRIAAGAAFLIGILAACALLPGAGLGHVSGAARLSAGPSSFASSFGAALEGTALAATVGLAAALLGGYLMAMLLGHAYLTAGNEMTQKPMRRAVLILAALLTLRGAASIGFGLVPYLAAGDPVGAQAWNIAMMLARYLVGLMAPAAFTWMTHDCVRRAANQSATGILYVTLVLVFLGEGAALSLMKATGLLF